MTSTPTEEYGICTLCGHDQLHDQFSDDKEIILRCDACNHRMTKKLDENGDLLMIQMYAYRPVSPEMNIWALMWNPSPDLTEDRDGNPVVRAPEKDKRAEAPDGH